MTAAFPEIKYKTHIDKLAHLIGMHYLEVPQDVVQQLGGKYNVRLLCTVNDSLTFQGGLVALGNGCGYISINTKRLKQLALQAGSEVWVKLEKDTSKYGMDVPEELEELLLQDPEGRRRFDNLTPGRQRYIIHYVAGVKSSQLRIDRAILLIENLKKLPMGKESFREMLGK
ncbi:YdeI/OmpD-associated family protein [Pontibacter sp. H249]|uniref:YdeI/OmpD-associated family protein n=1 Tax=Pontibacter sp. H249 TaxID=3133420 RepID=UPI0030BEC1C8